MSEELDQTTTSSSETTEEALDAPSPSRYLIAGIVTVLVLIGCCTGGALLLGPNIDQRLNPNPTIVPQNSARIELTGDVPPGASFTVRGVNFQPNEPVEIFIGPSAEAPFSQFTKLGDAVAAPDGTFVKEGLIAPNAPGLYVLVARGSASGFTQFTPINVSGTAVTPTPSPNPDQPTTTGPMPNLAIAGVRIELETGGVCAPPNAQLGIRVDILNMGNAPAGPFGVQVNNSLTVVQNGLGPGQFTSIWVPGYVTGPNTVVVDPQGLVPDSNRDNNTFSQPLPVPTLPPPCNPTPGVTSIVVTPTPNPNPQGSWFAQYYANPDLSGQPVFEQNLNTLNVNWGANSPGPNVPKNNWSAAFTSSQNFPSTENYLFSLTVDGGARFYIDGELVIDQWFNGGLRTVTLDRPLPAGPHSLRVEYYKSGSTARLALTWKANYNYWVGRYFNCVNRDCPVVMKRDDVSTNPAVPDPFIYFNWGTGSPAPQVNADNFSVDWQRTVNFPIAGTYVFTAVVDDGVRVFVDNTLVPGMDAYTPGAKTVVGMRALSAGNHFIQVQYVEFTGLASIQLTWALQAGPATATPTPTSTPIIIVPTTPPPITVIVVTNTPVPMATATWTLPPPPVTDTPTVPALPTPTWTLPPPPMTDTPTVPALPTPTETPTVPAVPTDTPTPTGTVFVIISP